MEMITDQIQGAKEVRKDTSHTIRRAEHFKTILTGEGFLVGVIAGLVVLLYRVLLEYAGKAMTAILQYARETPAMAAAWRTSASCWI